MASFLSVSRALAALSLAIFISGPRLAAALPNPADSSSRASAAPSEKNELTPDSVAVRRTAVQKEIAVARTELSRIPEGKLDDTSMWLMQETTLLERIENTYVEQQHALQHAAELDRESAEVDERTKSRRPPEAILKPPYNMHLLDQLYTERDYLEQARGWLQTDVTNATEALREARETADEKERDRRAAREALDKAVNRAKAQSDLRLAELESRLAQETALLRDKALHNLKLQQSLIQPKQALLLPNFDWLRAHFVITDDEVSSARAQREKRAAELDSAIATAREDTERASRIVVSAERHTGPDTGNEELESRRADRQTANRTLAALVTERDRLKEIDKVDQLRRRILTGDASAAEMKSLDTVNRAAIQHLEKERLVQLDELRKSRQELQELQGRLMHSATANEKAASWMNDRVYRLTTWIALCDRELANFDGLRIERQRLKEELGMRAGTFSVSDSFLSLRNNLVAAWNYEAFSVQDQPVRLKTILAFILMIGFGQWASRLVSDTVARTILGRLGMSLGRRTAWQTLSFYSLFLVVILVAFNLFHLSLTQFSVVSGALAVGLGFGSQNLLNNFMSGIILLVERPVNKGDVIEMEGQQVTVEKLGPRSTIVRSSDNTHMIVPNSRLLEHAVTNWTLSDDVVRRRIRVGVAYGSSTREVDRILRDVLKRAQTGHPERAPDVTFCDFGENALVFEAQFWCCVSDRIAMETEIRHRITDALAKAGISMAFPQRDIHLDTIKPLQIEFTPQRSKAEKKEFDIP